MAWIELHQALPTHKKTRRLIRALDLAVPQDTPQTVGHLCMFWLWCVDNAKDGRLKGVNAQDISDVAGWTGDPDKFFSAMLQAEFIDRYEDSYRVHDWDDYVGNVISFKQKERERNREKQRRYRERVKQQKEGEQDAEPLDKPTLEQDDPLLHDPEWKRVVQCYETNIGLIPFGVSGEMLISFVEDLSADVVCKAIEVTNKANPDNPWKYLTAILNKWVKKGINTPEKADAYTKDLERRLALKKREVSERATGQGTDGAGADHGGAGTVSPYGTDIRV